MKTWWMTILLAFPAAGAWGAPSAIPADSPVGQRSHKQIKAIRVSGSSPRVDGRLDDPVWTLASFASDFLQKDPTEGAPPTDQTEVAVIFDDNGLYVGAKLYCNDTQKLKLHLDRRDNQGPSEQFIVSIDSYRDKQTAYGFGVNTAGVRFDRYNTEDNEFNRDYSFNPVWHAETSVDEHAWYVEMFIPFSQLRFNDQAQQVWGINFNRWIPDRNEDVFWIYVPKNETGWSSRFGELVGIDGVKPSRRIELMPYAAGDANFLGQVPSGNPFIDRSDYRGRGGADLKVGLGPNLTLDATFNPDFGQVEADPAVVNLSAFETIFDERRPFFTEGNQLLNGPGQGGYFYSRRIGASPRGWGNGDYWDAPRNTSILGATKLTGRLSSGTSVGLLTALTQKENAQNYLVDSDSTYETAVEPQTLYGVGRVQQEFGANKSTVGFMLTGVHRDLDKGSFLDSLFRRQAITGGADWRLRSHGGQYELFGMVGFSDVRGSQYSIYRTQRSSVHYYQRPDIDWVQLDPTRTSLTGYRGLLQLSKRSGTHWLWSVFGSTKTPGLELNDIGAQGTADDYNTSGSLTYRETKPTKWFRQYSIDLFANSNWNYGGIRQFAEVGAELNVTWHNFWQTFFNINHQITGQSDAKTWGGPSMQNEAGLSLNAGFNNSFAAKTQYRLRGFYGVDELEGYIYGFAGKISTRVGTRWQFSLEPFYSREDQPRQYVTTVTSAGGGEGTYGSRYVFSRLSASTLRLQVRMNYYFSPNLSLEVYAEPFAAGGRFYDHGELVAASGHAIRQYTDIQLMGSDPQSRYHHVNDNGTEFDIPYRDFGERSFRSNIVLRWEFQPGSTLYAVWQRNLSEERENGRIVRPGSIFDSFGASGEDFVALKIAYWIPLS
ncbi:MAG: carbohydrate binding family 9 domain-containing protein [candidate division Zixibacteria bacterium]|nr:carbohydrate binding family 9 domain-containing protein [candidate division Zixibacteria bacterium]